VGQLDVSPFRGLSALIHFDGDQEGADGETRTADYLALANRTGQSADLAITEPDTGRTVRVAVLPYQSLTLWLPPFTLRWRARFRPGWEGPDVRWGWSG